jgi:hypothetical protein
VRIPERGVRDADGGALAQCPRPRLRAELGQRLTGTLRRNDVEVDVRQLDAWVDAHRRVAVRPVDRDVGEVAEQLLRLLGRVGRLEQLGVLVDERGRDRAPTLARRDEGGVREQRLQEGDVGGDATDAELPQRPLGPADGGRQVRSTAGELGQQ